MHKFSILKAEKPVINGRVCWVVVLIRSPAKAYTKCQNIKE